MKKLLPFLMTVSSLVSADFLTDNEDYAKSNEQLPMGYSAEAPIFPDGDGAIDWHIGASASFIWWDVNQENMSFATARTSSTTSSVTTNTLKTLSHEPSYEPGFQLAFFSDLGLDGWIGHINYTWLRTSTSSSFSSVAGSVSILPQYIAPLNATESTATPTITSEWGTNFNMLDFLISRSYYSGKALVVTSSMGMRWARLNQTWDISSDNFTIANGIAASNNLVSFSSSLKSESWLLGLSARYNLKWKVGYGLEADCYIGGSLFHQQPEVTLTFDISSATTTNRHYAPEIKSPLSRTSLESGIGVACALNFLDDFMKTVLSVRYDTMYLFEQNFLAQEALTTISATSNKSGTLSYQGLTVMLQASF